jgi:hypothetical protein
VEKGIYSREVSAPFFAGVLNKKGQTISNVKGKPSPVIRLLKAGSKNQSSCRCEVNPLESRPDNVRFQIIIVFSEGYMGFLHDTTAGIIPLP